MIGFPYDSQVIRYDEDGTIELDRAVKSDVYRQSFMKFFNNGVFANPSDNFQVLVKENMSLTVKKGYAFIQGVFAIGDTEETISLDKADGLDRIDRIVIRHDDNLAVRAPKIVVIKGTPNGNPQAPDLVRTETQWDICLADVLVKAGAIKLTQDRVTDQRLNSEVCGVVTCTIDQVDTTTIFEQYQSALDNYLNLVDNSINGTMAGYLENLIKQEVNRAMQKENDLTNKYNELSSRMDSFTRLQEGSTTGDAELIDGRVGYDGKTYDNIGGAIRGQVSQLSDDIDILNKMNSSINSGEELKFLPIIDWELGAINTNTGDFESSETITRSKNYLRMYENFLILFEFLQPEKYPNIEVIIYEWKNDSLLGIYRKPIIMVKDKKYKVVVWDTTREIAITPSNVNEYVNIYMTFTPITFDYLETKANMFEKNGSLEVEGLVGLNGYIFSISNCMSTNYIPIKGYRYLKYHTFLSNVGASIAFYDNGLKPITDLFVVSSESYAVEMDGTIDFYDDIYSNVAYIRMGIFSKYDTFVCRLYNKNSLEARLVNVETNTKQLDNRLTNIENNTNKKWNKTFNVMGDSISSLSIPRPSWWEIISENTGMRFNNYGMSGTTLAHSDERHDWVTDNPENNPPIEGYDPEDPSTWETGYCFVERVDLMDTSADGVIVMGGTNDSNVPRGPWKGGRIDTFFGALDELIKRLLIAYPGKPIIFCTMIQRVGSYSVNVPNPTEELLNKQDTDILSSMQLRAEAIKLKCKQYGIPCIDLYNHSGINSVVEGSYLYDNLHPNENGRKRIASIIQGELDKMFVD